MAGPRTRKKRGANQPKLSEEEARRVEPAKKKDEPTKTPATEADYISVMYHQALDTQNGLRKSLMDKEQEIVNLRVALGKKEVEIRNLEIAAAEAAMGETRKKRGMKLGRSIEKDDETGEIHWIDQPADANPK